MRQIGRTGIAGQIWRAGARMAGLFVTADDAGHASVFAIDAAQEASSGSLPWRPAAYPTWAAGRRPHRQHMLDFAGRRNLRRRRTAGFDADRARAPCAFSGAHDWAEVRFQRSFDRRHADPELSINRKAPRWPPGPMRWSGSRRADRHGPGRLFGAGIRC